MISKWLHHSCFHMLNATCFSFTFNIDICSFVNNLLKLKAFEKQGKKMIYFVIIFICNIPHFHCMPWIELNWISLVELNSIPHWIKIQFKWIQLKRSEMQIGGKGIEKLLVNMVLELFFEELKI
jgi:hypothetical protein